jgi:hypothetical protein
MNPEYDRLQNRRDNKNWTSDLMMCRKSTAIPDVLRGAGEDTKDQNPHQRARIWRDLDRHRGEQTKMEEETRIVSIVHYFGWN